MSTPASSSGPSAHGREGSSDDALTERADRSASSDSSATTPGSGDLQNMARLHGLWPISVRPPIGTYIKQLWRFRQFTYYMSTSRAYAQNQNSYLGQLWAVITPTLNALVYVVIFGLVLGTGRGLENVVAFIVSGIFMFRFFQQSVLVGGKSVSERLQLVRSLHFPRAILPVSAVITELTTLAPAILVMCGITLLSGLLPGYPMVPITLSWLLLPFAVALFTIFNAGIAMIASRIIAITPDVANVIQFFMRFVMYGSGVLFSIDHYITEPAIAAPLQHLPVAVYIGLARQSILNEPSIPFEPSLWIWGVGWAAVALVGGFVYFWRGEERYGRD